MMAKASKKKKVEYKTVYVPISQNNCICNLRYLTILILIILQFSPKNKNRGEDKICCGSYSIDNSILFIIALFFLTCW